MSLGDHLSGVEATLSGLEEHDVVARIWRKDHTVWGSDPTEIGDRLGWLTVTDFMRSELDDLTTFAQTVRDEGTRTVVLLGMGGSSLGPEVLRQTFGSAEGYPELIVLDSTVPEWVRDVTRRIDASRTLALVSSKSGGTIEPNVLYRHFRAQVEGAVGNEEAGQHFVAVTDSGSSLADLGRSERFRRVFTNPTDLGGRYSVLSYFGLVPAALTGVDVATLLDRADRMRDACATRVGTRGNPGAWLGAAMATLALGGRDKLTLVTSRSIGSFGLWVEQLIAESTGKEGKGIVPIAGEPPLPLDAYSADRAFVYLRLEGDDNAEVDDFVARLSSSGQPVVRLDLRDPYDLGAEFYRWEFATAVAGSILAVNPFDQPNVQAAKDVAVSLMEDYRRSGALPVAGAGSSWQDLVSNPTPGSYLAIMAYIQPTREVDGALQSLRRKISERLGIATTLGYGPRFLHSTGQLHKGGPATGLFLQLTQKHAEDVPIPGEAYTFGVLADAQAQGDLAALQTAGRSVANVELALDVAATIELLFGRAAVVDTT
jgi:glucose-6-phosphate isomerase